MHLYHPPHQRGAAVRAVPAPAVRRSRRKHVPRAAAPAGLSSLGGQVPVAMPAGRGGGLPCAPAKSEPVDGYGW